MEADMLRKSLTGQKHREFTNLILNDRKAIVVTNNVS
jgi:hypothetical protein